MNRESPGSAREKAFDSLHRVPPPDGRRQAVHRADFLDQVRRYRRIASSADQAVRRRRRGIIPQMFLRSGRLAMVGMLVAIILAAIAGTGGVIYAADAAVPGDPLYGLDRAVESARLTLTREPQPTTGLLLSFAEERLLEAAELSGKEDEENLEVALNGYSATISSLARALDTVEGVDEANQIVLLDEAFSVHEAVLAGIFGDEGDKETQEQGGSGHCVGVDPHPTGARLAETYDVDYGDVMRWFCESGYGFGEIMHALQTSQETSFDPDDLLVRKAELGGWGHVWRELGLIGPPENKPGGPPQDRPVGPPEDKPGGPPQDRPVGPPEDRPGGPREGRPVGPPQDRRGGPRDIRQGERGQEQGENGDAAYCVGVDPHPTAASLSETHDVPYEDVMRWFCEGGHGFGEIRLALETSEVTGMAAEELLARKTALGGWGQVWRELGLVGPPDHAGAQDRGGASEHKPDGRR